MKTQNEVDSLNEIDEYMNPNGRILIADQDETVLRTLFEMLQREGYQCTLVRNGLEATQELEANSYALMIAEIHMPGNEELELIQAIERYAPELLAIIYTEQPSLRSAITSIQLPVAAYLIKPVPTGVLLQHVKTSIAKYQASKQKEALLQRTSLYARAIGITIQLLQSTRSSFKSKKLAALRRQLERILEAEPSE